MEERAQREQRKKVKNDTIGYDSGNQQHKMRPQQQHQIGVGPSGQGQQPHHGRGYRQLGGFRRGSQGGRGYHLALRACSLTSDYVNGKRAFVMSVVRWATLGGSALVLIRSQSTKLDMEQLKRRQCRLVLQFRLYHHPQVVRGQGGHARAGIGGYCEVLPHGRLRMPRLAMSSSQV